MLVTLMMVACGETETDDASPVPSNDDYSEREKDADDVVPETGERVEALIAEVEDKFQTLIDDIDSEQRLQSFETKTALYDHLSPVLADQAKDYFFDAYFLEDNDGLYLIPSDIYSIIRSEDSYSISGDTAESISQTQEDTRLGTVEVTYNLILDYPNDQVAQVDQSHPSIDEKSVEDLAEVASHLLIEEAYYNLSRLVSKDHGLTLAPYLYVTEDTLIFSRDNVASFYLDSDTYLFGYSDGKGEPLDYTPREYFEEFLHIEPLEAPDAIYVDAFSQHGNSLNNTEEAFEGDITVIEYHHEGTEEFAGMDWRSMHFVFRLNDEGIYKLVGILSDEWTI